MYETRLAKVDVDRRRVDALKKVNPTVSHLLPDEPNKIILSFNPSSDIGSRLADRFRPRAYYKFDVERGTKQLILQGQAMVAQVEFDGQGHPWTARGFDLSKGDFLWYIRRPGESGWEEVWRQSEDSFETFRIEGFDEENRNILFVTAHNGNDKAGLWEFDASRKEFSSPVYRRPLLLVHRNVDQRVPPAHARKYRRELERHGKPYRFVELDGADHFYDTLFYEHQLTLYQSLIDYLQNDCGPDGLYNRTDTRRRPPG